MPVVGRSLLYRSLAWFGLLAALAPAALRAADPSWLHLPRDLTELSTVAYYLIGVFVFVRRPNNLAARRFLLVGVSVIAAWSLGDFESFVNVRFGAPHWFWLLNAVEQAVTLSFAAAWIGLLAVFPDGAYQRRYERWVVWAAVIAVPVVPLLLLVSVPVLVASPYTRLSNALSSPLFMPPLSWLSAPLALPVFVVVALVLVVLRYRRVPAEERLQMKWPIFAAALFALVPISNRLSAFGLIPTWLADVLFWLLNPLLPLAVTLGLLRHRLMDIDLVIRRSVVYATLWLAIALGYVGLAAALGVAAAQRYQVGAAIVVTLAATLLFQPARRRLEQLADRWVFGEPIQEYDLLRQFGATLEETFDLHDLAPRVASTARRGLRVKWVRVWSHDPRAAPCLTAFAADGIELEKSAMAEVVVAMAHSGEFIGALECGPKEEGHFRDADRDLISALGRQAALGIRNSRMAAQLAQSLHEIEQQAAQLAASRARLVEAQESERRRIERDIHDGVQQELVAMLAKIRIARNQAARDPASVEATLLDLQQETRQTLKDLRDLVRGIHPAVLGDQGLVKAIEARVAQLPLSVNIESDEIDAARLPEAIEGAAYFFVSEGLTNVMKHSGVEAATVRVHRDGAGLLIEVVDHGRGFDVDSANRSGLAGLQDRVEAAGGTVTIRSSTGGGAVLSAWLPAQRSGNG